MLCSGRNPSLCLFSPQTLEARAKQQQKAMITSSQLLCRKLKCRKEKKNPFEKDVSLKLLTQDSEDVAGR